MVFGKKDSKTRKIKNKKDKINVKKVLEEKGIIKEKNFSKKTTNIDVDKIYSDIKKSISKDVKKKINLDPSLNLDLKNKKNFTNVLNRNTSNDFDLNKVDEDLKKSMRSSKFDLDFLKENFSKSSLNVSNLDYVNKKRVFVPATPFKRIMAFILDFFIFSFFVTPLSVLFKNYGLNSLDYNFNFSFNYNVLFISFFVIFLFFIYQYLFQIYLRQTPGMMFFKITLISVVQSFDGHALKMKLINIPTWKLFVRNLVFVPIFPFVSFWFIDLFYLFLRKNRLSDMFLKIMVVEEVDESLSGLGN